MKFETLAVHAGRGVDPATGAVELPIHLSTTFERAGDGSLPAGFSYTRSGNPTRVALESCLSALEGGAAAAAFSSGLAAAHAVFQTLEPGAHVICTDGYYGTGKLLTEVFGRWGVESTMLDTSDSSAVADAMRPATRLLWIETPTNPRLQVTDIGALSALARSSGALLVCDNTVGTPMLQRPLELGAHMVMHSTTKYLSGHSDVLGGAVVTAEKDELFDRIQSIQWLAGGVPSPFDCWLALRGIKTLPYRVRAQSENALSIALELEGHPKIERVNYPGLPSHPSHALAVRQMRMFGGLLSIQVRGGREEALSVASRVELFTRATSLGGTESLIEHRASIEDPSTSPENLLRLSIGLEHPDDLIADLHQALG